jgi:hypothetical protein
MHGRIKKQSGAYHAIDCNGSLLLSNISLNQLKLDLVEYLKQFVENNIVIVEFEGNLFKVVEHVWDDEVKKHPWDSTVAWAFQTNWERRHE